MAHELIGLDVLVKKSSDVSRNGLMGKIVGESKNVFVIESKNIEKIVPKNECFFEFDLIGEKIEVDGKFLAEKPENRIKVFFKKYAKKR